LLERLTGDANSMETDSLDVKFRLSALAAERDGLKHELQQERALRRSFEQQLLLSSAQKLASEKRWMASGSLALLGFVGIAFSFPLAALATFGLMFQGAPGYAWATAGISAALLLAAAMPVDTQVIRAIAGLGIVAPMGVLAVIVGNIVVVMTGVRCSGSSEICAIDSWVHVALACTTAPVPMLFHLLTLRLRAGATRPPLVHVWQWTRERMGKCLALLICAALLPMAMALATPEQSFAVEPRMALQRYWAIFRAWQFSIALGCFFSVTACNVYGLPWEPKVVAWVFEGFVTLLLAAAATPQNRDRLHTALSHLTVRSEADAAAGIAALLGNVDPKVALANAQSSFAGIPLSKLKKEHFSSSQDSSLTAYAVRCRLGAVDAFLSHSWRDSPDHKWAALMEWAEDFACTSTRDPLLWLDKACINQNDIQKQLACLPIYLSGCSQMLVVAGPTYTERLWCVIEIFTFLRMGGCLERLALMPIGSATESPEEAEVSVLRRFETFDAASAKCFNEAERQHLLAGLETGFGSLQQFNNLIANVFAHARSRATGTVVSDEASRFNAGNIRILSNSSIRHNEVVVGKHPNGPQPADAVQGHLSALVV